MITDRMIHTKIKYECQDVRNQKDLLSDQGLAHIATKLGNEWKRVMVTLGLRIIDIDHIESDNPRDTVMQITKALMLWRNRNICDETAKIKLICEALKECDRPDLVEDLHQRFSSRGTDEQDNSDTCPVHSMQAIRQFCRLCKTPVCNACIEEKHKTHEIDFISKIAEDTIRDLNTTIHKVRRDTNNRIVITRRKFNTEKSKSLANVDVAVTLVDCRADELKDEIDTIRDMRIHQLEEYRAKIDAHFEKVKSKLLETEDTLHNAEQLWDKICSSERDTKMLQMGENLNHILRQINIHMPSFTVFEKPEFIASELNTEEVITSVFGHCNFYRNRTDVTECETATESIRDVIETKLESQSTFQHTENNAIRNIKANKDGNIWIIEKRSKHIALVNKNGEIIKTIPVEFQINSIEALSNGEVLATAKKGSSKYPHEISKIRQNGDTVSFLSAEKLIPCSMTLSRTGYIYVGMVDSYSFTITSSSTRAVKKFTSTGLYKREYQFNEKGEHLFIQPYSIHEHENGDIWVRNRFALVEGNVIVLDKTGRLKFKYCGVSTNKTQAVFYPGDLCCLPDSNVIISDTNNHILHLVDASGHLLQFLNSQSPGGLKAPTALSVDSEGLLWVGSLEGNIQILKHM